MPNRILREGIELPNIGDLKTEAEILAVRATLPKVAAGDHLQSYKWRLACKLRFIRMKEAGALSDALVKSMIAAAGETCPKCHYVMRIWQTGLFPTIDHVRPLSKGGTNDRANLRVICNRCNSKKGGRA